MYDLRWKHITYEVTFLKGGREYPYRVVMEAQIPAEDLIRYERSLVRPYRSEKDGGTTVDLSPSELEDKLFDKYFVEISGSNGRTREKQLEVIPKPIKSATINAGIGGVAVNQKSAVAEGEATLDAILASTTEVEITALANGEMHSLKHTMAEPSADDEMAFRKATVGSMKQLGGRKRPEYMITEDFRIFPKMYDKLVQGVQGYQLPDETPFKDCLDLIPYFHKKQVVRQLFGTAVVRQDEDDEFFRNSIRAGSKQSQAGGGSDGGLPPNSSGPGDAGTGL